MSSFYTGTWIACLTAMIAAVGCRSSPRPSVQSASKEPTTVPSPHATWDTRPIVAPKVVAPVVEGPPPLIYLVASASTIRVVDLTSQQDLLVVKVPAQTLICVSDRAGISVGGATLRMGPLPANHSYGIFFQTPEPDIVRSGSVRYEQPAQQPSPSGRSP